MEFDLDQRSAALSIGEFASFQLGPDSSESAPHGIWRAQLGTHWHQELRRQTAAAQPDARFEVPITGQVLHRGWTLTLSGRADQILPQNGALLIREIKTTTRPLPAEEAELRATRPEYFAQAATYLKLCLLNSPDQAHRAEVLFVETASGLAQAIPLGHADEALFQVQLERVAEFLDLRARARERLRHLRFHPAFTTPRPGQANTLAELNAAFSRHPVVLFEAPTGFGKTGVLLEFALTQLRSGHFDRALYLTSKSTGQLQVMRQLSAMTAPDQSNPIGYSGTRTTPPSQPENDGTPLHQSNLLGYFAAKPEGGSATVTAWHVRNKSEHCVNSVFHCVRDACPFLDGMETRWPHSGLSRFYLFENQPHDLESLRAAGREAMICPYEITRAALAFSDLWIGDYNYEFSPSNRGLFHDQPGFDPARSLLIIDEAHNLPSRSADAHSHTITFAEIQPLLGELDYAHAPRELCRAWESYTRLIGALHPTDSLDPALEDDLIDTLGTIAALLEAHPLNLATLGPDLSGQLWRTPTLAQWCADHSCAKLIWCPRRGELSLTCLDAAPAISASLHSYGGVVLASATIRPPQHFIQACGLDTVAPPTHLVASTPWRDGAYAIGIDTRVSTTYQQRGASLETTAATVVALANASHGAVVVFFSSYAYAGNVARALAASPLRVAVQPRLKDLATQTAWLEESLIFTDALFLILGSSFAESIDRLGGRISHAMVVGPALPEVNAVQKARMEALARLGDRDPFHRVYQIPGMQKINQALGRLVRAPGQRAKVLLHGKRFAEVSYANLLAPDYQFGEIITDDAQLGSWLDSDH